MRVFDQTTKAAMCMLLVLFASSLSAQGASRVALVVGNNEYATFPKLLNPINDTRAVGAALRQAGFEVIPLENATTIQFFEALEKFKKAGENAEVGLLYYAGHGIEIRDKNYLLPIDADLSSYAQVRLRTVPMETILADLADSSMGSRMVILDCCRDLPLDYAWLKEEKSRGAGDNAGLAEVPDRLIPPATMVMYSAGPGQKASDGRGDLSPFAESLLKHLQAPGQTVFNAFFDTSDDVRAATESRQIPWVKFEGSAHTFRELVLRPGGNSADSTPASAPTPIPPTHSPESVPSQPTSTADIASVPEVQTDLGNQTYTFQFNEFEPGKDRSKVLQGREWAPLTELEIILDQESRQSIRQVLKRVDEKNKIRFIVLTVKPTELRSSLELTQALLSELLYKEEGGVFVFTEDSSTMITAYTTPLETRLGADKIKKIDSLIRTTARQESDPSRRILAMTQAAMQEITRLER